MIIELVMSSGRMSWVSVWGGLEGDIDGVWRLVGQAQDGDPWVGGLKTFRGPPLLRAAGHRPSLHIAAGHSPSLHIVAGHHPSHQIAVGHGHSLPLTQYSCRARSLITTHSI
jgi:hypothetical protein